MPLYEHVFLARQDISAQQVEGLVDSFRSIIESNGGSIGKTEYWGVRSLTFRIKKNRKAHLQLINIDAPCASTSTRSDLRRCFVVFNVTTEMAAATVVIAVTASIGMAGVDRRVAIAIVTTGRRPVPKSSR